MPRRKDFALAGAGLVGAGVAAWRTMFPWIGDDIKALRMFIKGGKKIMENVANERYLIDMFEDDVKKSPQKAFMIFEDRIYTYEFIDRMANKVANLAMTWDLPVGDTVAIMLENEPAFVWTFLGLLKIGVASAMINYHLSGQPLTHSINASGAKVFIVGENPSFLESIREIRGGISSDLPTYVYGKHQSELPDGYMSMDDELQKLLPVPVCRSVRQEVTPSSPLCYIYTSGTTGLPKPAIANQLKAMSVSKLFSIFDYSADDTIYIVTPLYHSSAMHLGFFNTIGAGATFVLRRKFSARHYWEDVRKYNVTVLLYIGELCRYVLATPKHPDDGKHKVRCAFGNGLRQDIWTEYKTRFNIPNIYEFFGATEGTGGFINVCDKAGSVGRHSPFMKFLAGKNIDSILAKYDRETFKPVRDKNGRCIQIKPGDQGLLLTLIPPLHPGFYKGPKEMNEKKIVRDVLVDGDAWFNFGDVLYLDSDYNVYFRDRTGDTFRWKSENVSTAEVSNVIAGLDFIRDVNVYGVEVPGNDGKGGMAAIMLKQDNKISDELLRRVYKRCEHELPSYARPLFLRFMEEFIITQTMKNRKIELVKDGFDPNRVHDPLYVIDTKHKTYKPLTEHNYSEVLSAKL